MSTFFTLLQLFSNLVTEKLNLVPKIVNYETHKRKVLNTFEAESDMLPCQSISFENCFHFSCGCLKIDFSFPLSFSIVKHLLQHVYFILFDLLQPYLRI